MASFAHIEFPDRMPGLKRAQRATKSLKNVLHKFDGARGLAAFLLAAIVASLLVIANQVIDTWTEGHLLAAWIVMWAVAFAALALLALPARRLGVVLQAGLARWAAARRQAAQDERLWQVALTDARVMADLSRAMSQAAERDVRAYY